MIKNCVICGREYRAQRSTAKYCSNRCRLMAQRGYAYTGDELPPDVAASMTDDEVLGVVSRAHEAASDMSRASMLTPAPLCLALKRASRTMEDAVRSEGL